MTSMLALSTSPAYDFSAYKSLENDALTKRIQQVRDVDGLSDC